MDEIIIKKSSDNIFEELASAGFDADYAPLAQYKYKGAAFRIFNLKPYEANILKQECISLGFDCAVSRDAVTCRCAQTDGIMYASEAQYKKLAEKLKNQPFRLKEISEKLLKILNCSPAPLQLKNGAVFSWNRPYTAGIVNVTPDSFSDGGRYYDAEKAFRHALKLIEDGADIIDIGGESTRPGAEPVSSEEEIKRTVPVIKKLIKEGITAPVSIDTRNFETARAAADAGASIINDVSGFDYDKRMIKFAAENNIPSVIMHSDKIPAAASDFTDKDIVNEIYKNLYYKIKMLEASGMKRGNIIIDPGIGFGKSEKSCFEILKRLEEFKGLGAPLFIGISRKSFLKKAFKFKTDDLDLPSAFYAGMLKAADIHRVHNVKLTKQFLDFAAPLLKS